MVDYLLTQILGNSAETLAQLVPMAQATRRGLDDEYQRQSTRFKTWLASRM
jgi:hypothetical protein